MRSSATSSPAANGSAGRRSASPACCVVGALGVAPREAIGLMRLAAVDRERQAGRAAYEADS